MQQTAFFRKFFQLLHVTPYASEAVLVNRDTMTAFACNKDLKYHGGTKRIDIISLFSNVITRKCDPQAYILLV